MVWSENMATKVSAVAFRPDNKTLVFGVSRGSVGFIDLEGLTLIDRPTTYHTMVVTNLYFSPDGKRCISTSMDSNLIIWDVDTRKKVANYNREIVFKNLGITNGETKGSMIFADHLWVFGEDATVSQWKVNC